MTDPDRARADALSSYRAYLRNLRGRRGAFRDESCAQAALDRIASMLRPGSLRHRVFFECEVERTPFKDTAVRLGLSERHLYRIRREIINAIAHADGPVSVKPVAERAAVNLERAERAISHGDAELACAISGHLLGDYPPLELLPEALGAHARALGLFGKLDRARATLLEAKHVAGETHPCVRHAEASLAYNYGNYEEAIAICASQSETDEPLEPWRLRALARRMLFHAVLHQEGGDAITALKILDRCEALLRRFPVEPAAEFVQMLIIRAFAFGAVPGRISEARHASDAATARSLWHGLQFEFAWSQITQAWLRAGSDARPDAARFADEAVASARVSAHGDQLARILMCAARVARFTGDVSAGIERVRLAEKAACSAPWIFAVARMAHVRTLRGTADADTTIDLATQCIEQYERLNKSAYLGGPRVARAAALLEKGVRASDDVERALAYYERGAPLADRIETLNLSYKITKNPQHRALARDLARYALEARRKLESDERD